MHGFLDAPRNLELIGWAWDPEAAPGVRLRVEVALDGQRLRSCKAAGYRPDLLDAGIGDGRHAFSLELPPQAFDGRPHTLAATVDGAHLGASPMVFQSRYAGALEAIDAEAIRGWLRDESRPHATRVVAEVYADGRFLGSALAAPATGQFQVRVPRGFQIARVSDFALRAKGFISGPVATVDYEARVRREPVDVVVNADLGVARGLRALESIARSNVRHPYELFVVGDEEVWGEAAARLGFRCVASVEAGFRLHVERDVLLVEGDAAVVTDDWLDRFRRLAYLRPETASVRVEGVCGYIRRDYLKAYIGDTPGVSPLSLLYSLDYAKRYGRRQILVDSLEAEEETATASSYLAPADSGVVLDLRCTDGTTVWLDEREAYILPEERTGFLRACLRRRVGRFHIDRVMDVPLELFDLGIPYEVTVRDYSWICPRVDLIDETGRYCGEPEAIAECERCLRKLGPREDWGSLLHRSGSVEEMRRQHRRILEGACLVRFPSQNAATRIARYAPGIRAIEVVPQKAVLQSDPKVIEACRWDAFKRGLDVEFGGFYANTSPDLVAVEPLPTAGAFDLGATAEAMRAAGLGHLLLPVTATPRAINDKLVGLHE